MSTTKDVLYVMCPLLAIILIGFLIGRFKIFHNDFRCTLGQLNLFVFNLGIPCLVFQGLATKDFTDLEWDYVLVFLVARAAFGLISFLLAALFNVLICAAAPIARKKAPPCDFLGDGLTTWIGSTWMNTIIFGIPLLSALYGPGIVVYNILAAISSLFFQMPTMLLLFEIRAILVSRRKETSDDNAPSAELSAPGSTDTKPGEEEEQAGANESASSKGYTERVVETVRERYEDVRSWYLRRVPWPVRKVISLAVHIITNPPLIGVVAGLAYSWIFTTWAEEEYPQWLLNFTTWMGGSVTPLAAVCVGLFMNMPFFTIPRTLHAWMVWLRIFVFLIAKFILFPLLIMGLLVAFGFDGVKARAGVLIGALPVALAGFSISKKYQVGQEEQTACIALGTLLMLPVTLAWLAVLDGTEIWDDDDTAFLPMMPMMMPMTMPTIPCNATSNATAPV
eukprot:TRINITY_DN8278_c0_g1_i3.p1 TRINITY_DN8278_c0_g1~~TRINITY_DN8278_c0_g1_i3.p1  ORF type:complete len:450 (+),score=84.36 TRINITY_DN8278_c0_g1_i3:245-1594(+)